MQLFFSLLYTSAYPCTHCITWAPLYTFVYTNVHFCVDLCIPLCAYYCHFVYFVHLERKPLVITLQEHATIFFRPGIFNKRESLTDIVRLKPLPAVTITLCYTENCIINMLLLTTVVSFIHYCCFKTLNHWNAWSVVYGWMFDWQVHSVLEKRSDNVACSKFM